MSVFSIRVGNGFRESGRELVVYSSGEKKHYLVEPGGKRVLEIPDTSGNEPKHYLLIGVSPGVSRLPMSKVLLPAFAQLTFVPAERMNASISRSDSGDFFRIPEGPSTWQLQITAPVKGSSTAYGDGPDNVTVGEDEDGG
ncbi:MAG: hypothetical protein JSV88_20445 [Candidatus Aminicenantes bacterium]|nr:MAG: hypothetical protein JSV88_20445 [Candidatus Aminicenantes bacterium]